MSLTRQHHLNHYIVTYLLTYLLTSEHLTGIVVKESQMMILVRCDRQRQSRM